MKKLPLTLIILVILALFVSADYFLNNLDSDVAVNEIKNINVSADSKPDKDSGFIDAYYKVNDDVLGYKVISQVKTSQIFEKIDLNSLNNINIYRNRLEKSISQTTTDKSQAVPTSETIYTYEIHGPKNQGSLTYLHTKLQFIAQINGVNETINEVDTYGHNSFFFNDDNYKNTSFLLTQINDDLYGFQFNKTNPETGEDSNSYEDVKKMINNLMPNAQPSTPEQPKSQ